MYLMIVIVVDLIRKLYKTAEDKYLLLFCFICAFHDARHCSNRHFQLNLILILNLITDFR